MQIERICVIWAASELRLRFWANKTAKFKCASSSRMFCPEFLLLLALVIRYSSPGKKIRYFLALLNAALV